MKYLGPILAIVAAAYAIPVAIFGSAIAGFVSTGLLFAFALPFPNGKGRFPLGPILLWLGVATGVLTLAINGSEIREIHRHRYPEHTTTNTIHNGNVTTVIKVTTVDKP